MNHFSVVKRIKLFVRLGSITKSGIRFSHRNWPDEEPAVTSLSTQLRFPRKIVSAKDACSSPGDLRPARSNRVADDMYAHTRVRQPVGGDGDVAAPGGSYRARRESTPRRFTACSPRDDTAPAPASIFPSIDGYFITIMAATPVALAVTTHRRSRVGEARFRRVLRHALRPAPAARRDVRSGINAASFADRWLFQYLLAGDEEHANQPLCPVVSLLSKINTNTGS